MDIQIATAKKWPRQYSQVLKRIEEYATADTDTAGECFYCLMKAGERIQGVSVRFAEIALACWGNVMHGVRIIAIDDRHVTAQGFVFDIETNNRHTSEVKRRITKRDGKTLYSEDMIQTTAQAAASIALRNATFKVIPLAMFKNTLRKVQEVSLGKGQTMEERRKACLDYWTKQGVPEVTVLAKMGRAGIEDLTVEDLIQLRGMATALKEGMSTKEDLFRIESSDAKTSVREHLVAAKADMEIGRNA